MFSLSNMVRQNKQRLTQMNDAMDNLVRNRQLSNLVPSTSASLLGGVATVSSSFQFPAWNNFGQSTTQTPAPSWRQQAPYPPQQSAPQQPPAGGNMDALINAIQDSIATALSAFKASQGGEH